MAFMSHLAQQGALDRVEHLLAPLERVEGRPGRLVHRHVEGRSTTKLPGVTVSPILTERAERAAACLDDPSCAGAVSRREGRRDGVMTPHVLAADLLLINGRVLTMDARDAVAQAVAVRDGKIVAVGSTREIEPLAGGSTRVIDLDGRTAMPGLTDCHVHLASDSSRAVEAVECRDLYDSRVDSVAAIVSRIRQWAGSTPPGQWIIARGSPLADCRLAERRLPTRAELDAAAPANPTYISLGAHVVIANTLALREGGITRDTATRRAAP